VLSSTDRPKGYRSPKAVIAHAVYLYHRFTLSYRDVQELLFQRGIDVSHETIRAWCQRFGPEYAEGLKQREAHRSRTWHLDDMRVMLGGEVHWLWRAVNEHGDVLDVLLQKGRDTEAARRFFQRLLDDHALPEQIVTDQLRSYNAALRAWTDLSEVEPIQVRSDARKNNLIEQSHRPTRDQERQQRRFRDPRRTQCFLVTHAHLSNVLRRTRSRMPAGHRRDNWVSGFAVRSEVAQRTD
jgi:putative transposase